MKNVGPRQSLMMRPLLQAPKVSPQDSHSMVIAWQVKGYGDDDEYGDVENRDDGGVEEEEW